MLCPCVSKDAGEDLASLFVLGNSDALTVVVLAVQSVGLPRVASAQRQSSTSGKELDVFANLDCRIALACARCLYQDG